VVTSGGACAPATIENSNATYTDTVVSGGTLVLPDITVTDSDGSTYTQPSVEDVVCTLSPDTSLEVNGTPEGTFAAGSTIEVNITDGVNPVTPNDVTVVGDVVTIEVPSGDISTFTCSELINDTTESQQRCVRNYNFFSDINDFDPSNIILPTTLGLQDYSKQDLKVVYNANFNKYFCLVRAASVQIRVFDATWNELQQITISTSGQTDMVSIGDNVYVSNINTTNNIQRINADTYTVTNYSRPGRAAGLVVVGTDIYCPRGSTPNTETRLVKFDTVAETFTVTGSGTSTTGLSFEPEYDGSNVVAHLTTNTVVSFYSISGNADVANVSIPLVVGQVGVGLSVSSINYVNGLWYVVTQSALYSIDPSTYAISFVCIINSSTQLIERAVVYLNRYIVIGGWSPSKLHIYDTVTGRQFFSFIASTPFINDAGQVSFFCSDRYNYPLQTQGLFVINNFQL
jgi:hypothetical protein